MASFIRTVNAPPIPRSSAVIGVPGLVCANHHLAQTLAHIRKTGGEGQDRHDLAGNCNVVTGFARATLFFRALTDCDATQHTVVRVHNAPPCYRVRVDVQPHKLASFIFREIVRIGLVECPDLQAVSASPARSGDCRLCSLGRGA